MNENREISALIDHYRHAGAPEDQQMLIMLLREVQDVEGGVLSRDALAQIAGTYGIKEAILAALIRRIPSLRYEDIPHKLEICATCKCSASLRDYIESTFEVKSGSACKQFGFLYRTVNCMKNCKNGPSVRWDGELYSHGTVDLLRELIEKC